VQSVRASRPRNLNGVTVGVRLMVDATAGLLHDREGKISPWACVCNGMIRGYIAASSGAQARGGCAAWPRRRYAPPRAVRVHLQDTAQWAGKGHPVRRRFCARHKRCVSVFRLLFLAPRPAHRTADSTAQRSLPAFLPSTFLRREPRAARVSRSPRLLAARISSAIHHDSQTGAPAAVGGLDRLEPVRRSGSEPSGGVVGRRRAAVVSCVFPL
jgi:hypothetical protein